MSLYEGELILILGQYAVAKTHRLVPNDFNLLVRNRRKTRMTVPITRGLAVWKEPWIPRLALIHDYQPDFESSTWACPVRNDFKLLVRNRRKARTTVPTTRGLTLWKEPWIHPAAHTINSSFAFCNSPSKLSSVPALSRSLMWFWRSDIKAAFANNKPSP